MAVGWGGGWSYAVNLEPWHEQAERLAKETELCNIAKYIGEWKDHWSGVAVEST
jgi:hypothetical protein